MDRWEVRAEVCMCACMRLCMWKFACVRACMRLCVCVGEQMLVRMPVKVRVKACGRGCEGVAGDGEFGWIGVKVGVHALGCKG